MALTTKDVRLQGYPPLELILSHYDALPVLIQAVKEFCPDVLLQWDKARQVGGPPRELLPVTKHASQELYGEDSL